MAIFNREKLSDCFLDISKYVTTGVLITAFIGEIKERWLIYSISLLVLFGTLFVGMWLANKPKGENKKSKKK